MIASNVIDRLREERNQPDPRDLFRQGIADALDPEQDEKPNPYRLDPEGFFRDVLGIKVLTNDQKRLLDAVRRYETVIIMSATGVGKTYLLAAVALWYYKCWEEIEVYAAAAPPERNLKELLWAEMSGFVGRRPEIFKDDKVTNLMIKRRDKQKIEGVRIPAQGKPEDLEAAFSGKHAPNLVFIFDEADAIPDEVYKGADGCMSGGNAHMILAYNPKKMDGRPYDMISDGAAHVISMSAFDHPNVITGEDIIPGAVTQAMTIRRTHEWTEPVMDGEEIEEEKCFEVPPFLVGKVAYSAGGKPYPPLPAGWRRITDPQYSYKVLGRYPAVGSDQLIPEAWIDAAVSRWESHRAMNGGRIVPPPAIQPIMGFDVAGGGPDRQSLEFRYGGWIEPPLTHREMDTDTAAMWGARQYVERKARVAYVDMSGVGSAVPSRMSRMSGTLKQEIIAVGVYLNEEAKGNIEEGSFFSIRDEAFWLMREDFRTGTAMIPPADHSEACARLHKALRKLTYDKRNGHIKIIEKKLLIKRLGWSPDELESYMLTYAPPMNWMGSI